MIELAGAATAAPTEEDRLTHHASTDAAHPPLGGLVFDDTMAGLTLDEVSVVLVADRPVLVPLARELAERSGFTVVDVSDESLLSLGVAPRRPLVDPTEHSTTSAVASPFAEDPSLTPPDTSAAPEEPAASIVVAHAASTWATWPTPDPAAAVIGESGPTLVDSAPQPVVLAPPSLPSQRAPSATAASAAAAAPETAPLDRPIPTVQALTEAHVETARPINAMAASHLDWEPDALGWPYIDRRLELTSPDPAMLTTPSTPRSLASGRPVNGVVPSELVIIGDQGNADDVIVELRGAASVSIAPLTIAIEAMTFTVISGPRGSGKSSLLRLLAGFDAPTQGAGVVGGEQLLAIPLDDRAAREAISAGFIPQLPFLVPDLTVAENIELPLLASDVSPALARGVAEETLRMVGLGAVIGLPASVLSGGEIRLGAVARALVSSPEIVFADEPFAGLSDADAATVLSSLHDVVADGGTVIIACTDPRVRLNGVRQLVLEAGSIVRDEVVSTIG